MPLVPCQQTLTGTYVALQQLQACAVLTQLYAVLLQLRAMLIMTNFAAM